MEKSEYDSAGGGCNSKRNVYIHIPLGLLSGGCLIWAENAHADGICNIRLEKSGKATAQLCDF